MNDENLIPFNERSEEEARELGKLGGINSGASRRGKRDLKKRIAATWELATSMKKKELTRDLDSLLKKGALDDDPEVQLLKDKIGVLGVGGVEMLTMMEIVTNKKTSAMTKVIAIDNLFAHEFGKPKGNDTLTVQWGNGIGKSAAFTNQSILLGIEHGLNKLTVSDLDKVIEMIEKERKSRLTSENKLLKE